MYGRHGACAPQETILYMHPGASLLAMELGCVLVSAMHQVDAYAW